MTVKLFYYLFSYFSAAFILSMVVVPMVRPLAFRLGAVDKGSGRRIHDGVVPRLGGIGIFLSFVATFGFFLSRSPWESYHRSMIGILIASLVVVLIGTLDDLKGATIRNKLIAEVIAAGIIYAWGIRITVITNPFGGSIVLGALSLPVTVLWVVIITNALNLIDGLDGLAAASGILIAATFTLLPGTDFHLQVAYLILAGSLAGFLIYNFPPATIFMGDAGSLFIGFLLAATSILSSRKVTALATVMIPVVAFMFPLMDMFYAVIRRYYRGIALGEADREHIHHRLLSMGLSKKKVLFVISLANVGVMFVVLLLVRQQLNVDFIALAFVVVVMALGLRLLGYVKVVPFARELRMNMEAGRRGRYFNYIIKRFRERAGAARTLDELKEPLDGLMTEYGFSLVQMTLYGYNHGKPFYLFASEERPAPKKPLMLSFVIAGGEEHLGHVNLTREMDDSHLLRVAELARAVSEEVARLAKAE